ncbi:hypothetical protein [Hydrogenophaga sp.]|uniref:hypothetical protein n=1 Tax=Hydrogenophaga sp. TaxID=1904254 RepID=UPI0027231399|nr:hypothetical protein [Hydrogenophaga sp.]MDO9438900.1 hypothetical protein [Hydrogenophaga sp.]
MANDIRATSQDVFYPPAGSSNGLKAAGPVTTDVAPAVERYPDVQAEETRMFNTSNQIDQVDQLNQKVQSLEHELETTQGELSEEQAVEKNELLFKLRQQLDLLLHPQGSLADAPGL